MTTVAALALGWLEPAIRQGIAFLIFSLGVAVSAWYGGAGPGLAATLLGAVLGGYISLAPAYGPAVSTLPAIFQLSTYALAGAAISALGGRLHRTQGRAEESARAAERHLHERERMLEGLRIIAAGARCILWYAEVEDRGGKDLFWDLKVSDEEAAQRFFPVQIPPGLSYVQAWYESRLPEDKAAMDGYGEKQAREGQNYSQEFRCRRADGEIRWLAEDVQMDQLGPGRWRAVGVCTDITERKRAEEALRESEARFRRLFDARILGIGRWDGDGAISDANDAFLEMTGYTREELRGGKIRWRNLTPLEYRPLEERAIEEARRTGASTPYEKEFFRKDGTRVPVLVGGAVVDAEGRKGIFFALDLTEHKRLEDELRRHVEELGEADRKKDQFLAMLAHELRNPLAPIRTAAQVLSQLGTAEPRLVRAREIIERQVRHQARLLDDLLDVSRITRGAIELRRERLDLVRLTRDTAEDCRGILEQSGLTLVLELPDEPIWIDGDAVRLAQALGNLLHNAGKFTDPGGMVNVGCSVLGVRCWDSAVPKTEPGTPNTGYGVVSVRDTGIGIEPELLPWVFEQFAQGDRSLERSRGGLGLGLALVKGLVELHGGEVEAESQGSGLGTTFTLRLPLAPAPVEMPIALPPTLAPSSPLRILVVEDNRDAAESLRDLLELSGCTVEIAHSGPSGLEAARRFQPEVVLCDLGLPGMDGFAVAAALRQEPGMGGARLIAVSGYGQEEDKLRAREAGFDLHLTKPIDFQELQRLLEVAPLSHEA